MSTLASRFNTIEEAIADIALGKVIIVVDDEDRENEGDFVAAAEKVTPELVNFMVKHGRGLICAPLLEERCKELELDVMVKNSSDPMNTAFTVSVDLGGHGVTTGISAYDRAKTIKALADTSVKSHEFRKPGHVFPLIAKKGGVLRRTGHTEAAIDLARLAGLYPAGAIVEVMNEDGSMARLPQLIEIAKTFGLKIITIEQLVAYRMAKDSLIIKKHEFPLNTRFGEFTLHAYEQITNRHIHLAFTKGSWTKTDSVLVRINSAIISNDVLETMLSGSSTDPLPNIFSKINAEQRGAVLFLSTKSTSGDLLERLENIRSSKSDAQKIQTDDRDFGIGAQILHDLGICNLKLISNSEPEKRVGLMGYNLKIVQKIGY